jgi:para-nitrobenzyl esterase
MRVMQSASRGWRAAASAFLVGVAVAAGASPAGAADGPKVQTTDGAVRGFVEDGVARFYGIPYAAPPVGDLRWRPPAKPKPWTETRDATNFGPICFQVTTLGPFAGPQNDNEDCLYLNVYTPNVNPDGKGKLPVIVWLHGGANFSGTGNDYDGSKLARDGKTVVVTLNYRLSLLGFLAHPALDAEGHPFANYGLLDQQAALRWVRDNIGKFGGDKDNVLLGGQSAGSVDTESHVISPLAKGLFHRAIFQSVLLEPSPLATAQAKGVSFAVAAGCGSGADEATAKCLRNLTSKQIYNLAGTQASAPSYSSNIILDGEILPGRFVDLIAAGKFNKMPVMSGLTIDEQNFSLGISQYFRPGQTPATETDYENRIAAYGAANFPEGTQQKVRKLYPLGAYPSPQLALNAIGTDATVCTQRYTNQLLAPQAPVYFYEFADRTAPSYFPKMRGFTSGAYHTADIPYVFPGWHGGPEGRTHVLNKKQERLSDELVLAWTNFAWTGNPNGQGDSPWPRYRNKKHAPGILQQNIPYSTVLSDAQYSASHRCDFWDKTLTYRVTTTPAGTASAAN